MTKVSVKSIYQQNEILEGLLARWHSMRRQERDIFIEEVELLIYSAQQTKRRIKSQSTKKQLLIIIENWKAFLDDAGLSTPNLSVIAKVDKTFPSSPVTKAEKSSNLSFLRKSWQGLLRSISQPMSTNKVAANSPITVPHHPKLRDLYDEIYGIVDSTKHTE